MVDWNKPSLDELAYTTPSWDPDPDYTCGDCGHFLGCPNNDCFFGWCNACEDFADVREGGETCPDFVHWGWS